MTHSTIGRRRFLAGLGAGAGAALLRPGRLPAEAGRAASTARGLGRAAPLLVTSHDNETGEAAIREAWDVLSAGGTALDAVERAANRIEVDPEDGSVGYGGLPNERGVVQLDASIMDGPTYNAGAVAGLEDIMTPASVARLVMERTDHVMLVGSEAREFALSFGLEPVDLMTERSRRVWLRWREERGDRDDWGPPDHLRPDPEGAGPGALGTPEEDGTWWARLLGLPGSTPRDRANALIHRYGTTNVLAVDAAGGIAGITTTSGLAFKIPGRIGDSPIIGAGLYVDNDVGAAGATGRGEDVIKSCASYYIVSRMRDGRTPQQACEDALRMIKDRYAAIGSDFVPSEKFVAIDREGNVGCAWMPFPDALPRMSVIDGSGFRRYEGVSLG